MARCPSQVKTAIAAQLPWSSMAALLEDPEPGVRVRPATGVGRGVQACTFDQPIVAKLSA